MEFDPAADHLDDTRPGEFPDCRRSRCLRQLCCGDEFECLLVVQRYVGEVQQRCGSASLRCQLFERLGQDRFLCCLNVGKPPFYRVEERTHVAGVSPHGKSRGSVDVERHSSSQSEKSLSGRNLNRAIIRGEDCRQVVQ